MNSPLIIANWKMQLTAAQATALAETIVAGATESAAQLVLCPSFPALEVVSKKITASKNIALGAQDMHYEDIGAFTGAVSGAMVKEFCTYVILGHSERRRFFAETDEVVAQKVSAALRQNLVPIVCVGETREERDAGRSQAVVQQQLTVVLTSAANKEVIVAYEPVWAISTEGNAVAATSEEVVEMLGVIQTALGELGVKARVVYGGSVTAEDTAQYVGDGKMNGVLVGGASLKAESFLAIANAALAA